ncbi:MAG TPA: ATPase, T2SS/T4P/T4SS family, partial [Gammaproteobacteria bacterium]|nr:ATPase, T2SS/T4P/T4SS family [Gammaproteobacteria bacterium]
MKENIFSALPEESLVQFVDRLLAHAHQESVSDIHIEPQEHNTRIRYRQHGLLYEKAEMQPQWASQLIARLKIMADLDISERRQPQDGHFKINTRDHRSMDVRLSSCPTLHGEKIVLRLLDNSKLVFDFANLGLSSRQKELFLKKLSQPQGLILVTGPTGSGKTTTLYSALAYLNVKEKNILTIEDPVEIQLEGINQVPLN